MSDLHYSLNFNLVIKRVNGQGRLRTEIFGMNPWEQESTDQEFAFDYSN